MYPHDLYVFGLALSVWNAVFLLAVVAAAFVFRCSAAREPLLGWWAGRYAVFVYLSALAAQVFAYAFDAHTSMTPPPDVTWAGWYLDPLAGPKTLYGVLVLAPVSVAVATLGARISIARALDLWTPAILTVLGLVRVGCLLEGCCYGARSDVFGAAFPAGSLAAWRHVSLGLVVPGEPSLPVVPAQALEAVFFGLLALWSLRREESSAGKASGNRTSGDGCLFAASLAAYSVFRFVIEFVRADEERGIYGPLATSQWIALAVLGALAILAWVTRGRRVGARDPAAGPVAARS